MRGLLPQFPDAPRDGGKYLRQDGGWVATVAAFIDGEVETHADLPVTLGIPPINSV
jgi:hypothetical protein